MSARILDGRATARQIKAEVAARVVELKKRGVDPGLGTLLVGNDPGSEIYVAAKHRDCAEVGIESVRIDLPADATQRQVEDAVDALNADSRVSGYIVQLPLPAGLDPVAALARIDPSKDADGLHPMNLGTLVLDAQGDMHTPEPCTPAGIIELLKRYDIELEGAAVCIIGAGATVGRPLAMMMTRRGVDASVALLHSKSKNIPNRARKADIIVAAAGSARLVKPDWVKPGAIVVDVGITRVTDPVTGKSRQIGDVDPAVAEVASWLAPNPGGIGPMTRAMLLRNVVRCAEAAQEASAR